MQGIRTHIYLWPRETDSPGVGRASAAGCVVLLNGEGSYAEVVAAMRQYVCKL
jgi:hypothetical protein